MVVQVLGSRRVRRLCVSLLGVAALAAPVALAAPAWALNPAIVVSPSSGLTDGQSVTVDGSEWVPGHSIALFQCHNSQLPNNQSPCGNFAPAVTAGVNGAFQAPFTVSESLVATNDGNTVYDCATSPGCSLIAGDNATATYRSVQLSFGNAPASPAIVVSPSSGLTDGQNVTVTGTGYTPTIDNGQNVWIGQCLAVQGPAVCDKEPAHQVFEPVNAQGGFSRSITVHETFTGGTDADPGTPIAVDCTVSPGCFISGGQANPNISAYQLISFGNAPANPAIVVSPSTGLTDGQNVTVDGSGYTPSSVNGQNVWIGQCLAVQGPAVCDKEPAHQVFEPVDAQGGFSRSITVHETFTGGTDADPGTPIAVDCTVSPGCFISGGQANPNISAYQLISFGNTPANPAIVVSPSTGLTDGQNVTVSGTGWVPGHSIALFQCHNTQLPNNQSPCGNFAPSVTADVNGAFQASFTVHENLVAVNNGNTVYDCAIPPGCNVIAGDNATNTYRAASLSFGAAPSNQTVTVTPASGLSDGDVVTVSGTGWGAGGFVSLLQCANQPPLPSGNGPCHISPAVQADANGAFTAAFVVHDPVIATEDGNPYSCSNGCGLVAFRNGIFAVAALTFNVDGDGDGVANTIDSGNGAFTDVIAGQPDTTGSIVSLDAGLSVLIEDAADPLGVRVTVGAGTGEAVLDVCGESELHLTAGSQAVLTCGSVTITVVSGLAVVVLSDDTTVSVPAGVTATLEENANGTFEITDVSGGTVTVTIEDTIITVGEGDPPTTFTTWDFSGFTRPVDNPDVLNVVQAGQAVPLKWRLLDASGAPVTTLTNATINVEYFDCVLGTTADVLEQFAAGSSGLQNLGDGYYQLNWKTPKSYADSCRRLKLDLGEGVTRDALFKFKA